MHAHTLVSAPLPRSPIRTPHGSDLIETSDIFACAHCQAPMAYVRLPGGDIALECGNHHCGWTCGLDAFGACAVQGGSGAPQLCLSCADAPPAPGLRLCDRCRQEAARRLYAPDAPLPPAMARAALGLEA